MTDTDVRELTSEAGWREAFPVLVELREDLTEEAYLEYLDEMQDEGYRLFALYEDDAIVSLAGVAIRTNFYNGRHLFVYDLVTREDRQSTGYGTQIMDYVTEWARDRNCEAITLESGLWRDEAHRFYEDRLGMDRFCYTFKKELDE
jgi:GNAT superfamily N-acetyltransferase